MSPMPYIFQRNGLEHGQLVLVRGKEGAQGGVETDEGLMPTKRYGARLPAENRHSHPAQSAHIAQGGWTLLHPKRRILADCVGQIGGPAARTKVVYRARTSRLNHGSIALARTNTVAFSGEQFVTV